MYTQILQLKIKMNQQAFQEFQDVRVKQEKEWKEELDNHLKEMKCRITDGLATHFKLDSAEITEILKKAIGTPKSARTTDRAFVNPITLSYKSIFGKIQGFIENYNRLFEQGKAQTNNFAASQGQQPLHHPNPPAQAGPPSQPNGPPPRVFPSMHSVPHWGTHRILTQQETEPEALIIKLV